MITIAKPKNEEVKQIQEVIYITWLATYLNEEVGITKADIEKRFRNRFSRKAIQKRKDDISNKYENKLFLVAKEADRIVGVCELLKENKFNILEAIYVLPEYQGRGISKMFWEVARKFWNLDNDIIVQVATYNKKAIKFYKELGFVDSGKRFAEEKHRMPISGICIPEMELVIKGQ